MSIKPVKADQVRFETVWEPIPHSSQLWAVSCPCNEVLYDGSRGPGKTDAQLMRFRSLVGKGYGQFLRGIIFDREYKNLDDIVAKSNKHFKEFKDGARFLKSKGEYKWVWPGGEELLFRQVKTLDDYYNFHGQEFPWIGWNELTKYPNPNLYNLMKSCNRSGFLPEKHTPRKEDGSYDTPDGKPLPPIPLQIFSTTNPWGPGHSWVKEMFVDDCEPGEIVRITTEVFNPRTKQREPITRTRTRLFGTYKENIYLDAQYIANLELETDPERRKAWLLGDWNIRAGGMFTDVWKPHIHVIPPFNVPRTWRIDRAFDWGGAKPFSVGWYCVANGESVTCHDGTVFTPKRGSLIRFAEWYGTSGGYNVGLALSSPEIAEGILKREMEMKRSGLISTFPTGGPADGAIFSDRPGIDDIALEMKRKGICWHASDKTQGTRIRGWQLIRDMLTNSIRREGPGLYFTKSNKFAIKFMPDAPRDEEGNPDDILTEWEDHLCDELRYRVLDINRKLTKSVKTSYPN